MYHDIFIFKRLLSESYIVADNVLLCLTAIKSSAGLGFDIRGAAALTKLIKTMNAKIKVKIIPIPL